MADHRACEDVRGSRNNKATMRDDERDYRERYVAFLDVLGFSQLVRSADKTAHEREIILTIVKSLRTTLDQVPETSFQFTQFSDCIVISADRSRDGLLAMFSGVVALVADLLTHGVMLRGGITVGNLVHTREILFGLGLLNAYSRDRSGGPPRISLDESVVQDSREHHAEPFIRHDPTDATPMLHTLWEFEVAEPGPLAHSLVVIAARKIAGHITANALEGIHPDSVRAKWAWLHRYWNASVTPKGYLPQAL